MTPMRHKAMLVLHYPPTSSVSTNNRFVTLFGYFSTHCQSFFLVMYLSSSRLPKDAVISVYVLVLVWLKSEGIEGASDY